MNNNKISIIIVVIFVIAIIIYCNTKSSGGAGSIDVGKIIDRRNPPIDGENFVYSPTWVTGSVGVSSEITYNSEQPVNLVFTYNYNIGGYSKADLSFSLVLVKCGSSDSTDACYTPKCGMNTDNPYCEPDQTANVSDNGIVWTEIILGTDTRKTESNNTVTYTIPASLSNDEDFEDFIPGIYTAYVMSYLTTNDKVQSDPSQTMEDIIILTDEDPLGLPKYTLSAVGGKEYTPTGGISILYYSNITDFIKFPYKLTGGDSSYDYQLFLKITDITASTEKDVTTTTGLTHGNSSYNLSATSNIYPGEFEAVLLITQGSNSKVVSSNVITYVVKLQAPSDVTITQ
jgi:hypothetical protein